MQLRPYVPNTSTRTDYAGQDAGNGGVFMVSRKVLEERGVFTCDMDELREQLDEIHGTLTMLATHGDSAESAELLLALQGVARAVTALRLDVSDIDEVLRDRGAIIDAHEYLQRERERRDAFFDQPPFDDESSSAFAR